MSIKKTAERCYEILRLYESAKGLSLPAWSESSKENQKDFKEAVKFVNENPKCKAKDLHKNWMAYMKKDGWKHGPFKDESRKEWPRMVPFKELPKPRQDKYDLILNLLNILK